MLVKRLEIIKKECYGGLPKGLNLEKLMVLILVVALMFTSMIFPTIASADDIAGLIDEVDDFSNIHDNGNVWIIKDHPEYFQGDGARMTAGSAQSEAYFTYKTDYGITSFSIIESHWEGIAPIDLKVYVCGDENAYNEGNLTELTLEKYHVQKAGTWPMTVFECYDIPQGTRFLKIVIPDSAEKRSKNAFWASQVNKVIINKNVAPVSADPAPGVIHEPIAVTLSTRTEGAQIHYTINGGQDMLYTEPLQISSSSEITAYAVKEGYVDSVRQTFKYTTTLSGTPYTHSGNWGLKIAFKNTWKSAFQQLNVTSNMDYEIKCWIKGSGRVRVMAATTGWSAIPNSPPAYFTANDTWTQVRVPFNSGTNTKVLLLISDASASGTMYVDDVYVGTVGDGPNLIANWDFEQGKIGWNIEASAPMQIIDFTNIEKQIDTYGQYISAEFNGKVKSDDELQADVGADEAYYGSLTPPERDIYGGLQGSMETYGLDQTGFFHTEKLDNGKFVMVDPLGNLYFSLGVDGISTGDTFTNVSGREEIYEWLPPYQAGSQFEKAYRDSSGRYFSFYVANQIKKYGRPIAGVEFYNQSVARLKKLGFTSDGGWSSIPSADQNDTNFPQTRVVKFYEQLPATYLLGGTLLPDIYKDGISEVIEQILVNAGVPEHKDDPLILGYCFGNELRYSSFNNTVLGAKASQCATKGALIDMLESEYQDISSFNSAWDYSYSSFDDMRETALQIKTDAAVDDMYKFFVQYLDKFYSTFSTIFRQLDPNHMYMGDRLADFATNSTIREAICEVSGKYVDIVSYNYYADDPDLARLRKMTELADKPIIVTEYHWGKPDHGYSYAIMMAKDETEQGLLYRNYVEQVAASGYVVGTHWFEYIDEATTGRWYDGETAGVGLIDITDRPYKKMLESAMATNYSIYDVITGQKIPFRYTKGGGSPELKETDISKINSPVTVDGVRDDAMASAKTLNVDKYVLGTDVEGTSAEVNVAWDDTNLYVFMHINDVTPMLNPKTGSGIWNGDGLELFIGPERINESGGLKLRDTQLLINGQNGEYYWANNRQDQPQIQTAVKLDDGGDGYSIEAAIPLESLYISDAADGRKIRFDIGLDNGNGTNRVGQYMWSGTRDNSTSRDNWGYATFVANEEEPPVTAAEITGQQGIGGWYTSDVTVTFVATDDISGVDKTEYSMDGGETWETYSQPLVLTADGQYEITYRSIDKAGNIEEAKSTAFAIDKTAPIFSLMINGIPFEDGSAFEDYQPLSFAIEVEDNLSGIATSSIVVDGGPYQPGTQMDFAGELGQHSIVIAVEDKAGNRAEASYTFEVITSIDSMQELLNCYKASGEIKNPLFMQLSNDLKQAEFFMDKVENQLGLDKQDTDKGLKVRHKIKDFIEDIRDKVEQKLAEANLKMAVKHMEDFKKHLNNKAMSKFVSEDAKAVLNTDADALIETWSEE